MTSATAQFGAMVPCDWYGPRYVADTARAPPWVNAAATLPVSAATTSVDFAAR